MCEYKRLSLFACLATRSTLATIAAKGNVEVITALRCGVDPQLPKLDFAVGKTWKAKVTARKYEMLTQKRLAK